MAIEDRVVRRDAGIRSGLIGTLVIAIVAVAGLSERPVPIGSQPHAMAGLPAAATNPDARRIIDTYGIHTPELRHRPLLLPNRPAPPPPRPVGLPPLRFGYAIVETDLLGMPFRFRRDDGDVPFYDTTDEYVGRQGSAWWSHLWGWLFVAAAAGIGLFELGAMRRRRETEGMI